jgi:hypothetical protein
VCAITETLLYLYRVVGSQSSLMWWRSRPTLILCSGESLLFLSGHLNLQKNKYWSAENPVLIYQVPLQNVKVGV